MMGKNILVFSTATQNASVSKPQVALGLVHKMSSASRLSAVTRMLIAVRVLCAGSTVIATVGQMGLVSVPLLRFAQTPRRRICCSGVGMLRAEMERVFGGPVGWDDGMLLA